MTQILLIALAAVVVPIVAKLALAFIDLLTKLVAGGVVVGGALYLIVTFLMHGHPF
jgi:hypothetical protein